MELIAEIPLSKINKVEIYQNTSRLTISQIRSHTGADYIINGGIYNFQTFKPFGNMKVNGKIVSAPGYGEYGFAWNHGSDISYERLPCGKSFYIGCVGMVRGGTKQKLTYNSDMGGSRQRSAIGLKGGHIVLYACNGIHSKTPEKLQAYAVSHGWENALMLDGGGSTQAFFNGQSLKSMENSGKGRIVQNYILVYLKADTATCPYKEPSSLVKNGTRGEGAKWVQWQLNRAAHAGLSVDGIFGKGSVTALTAFQKGHGLTPDGVCGVATRAALKES